jgi:aminopeptidase N
MKKTGTYELHVKQLVGAGQQHLSEERRREKPMHVPIVVGLLDKSTGEEVVPSKVLELTQPEQTFSFSELSSEPVPSLLRNFSAPVKLEYPYSDDDLAFLAAYDTDSFNRWEATQILGTKAIKAVYEADPSTPCKLPDGFADACRRILNDRDKADTSLVSYALTLPPESTVLETMTPPVDPVRLHEARKAVRKALALEMMDDLQKCYAELSPASGDKVVIDGANTGKRRLRNICLGYLCAAEDPTSTETCAKQFAEARSRGCMTDKLAALAFLANVPDTAESKRAIQEFYEDAAGDALVLNKWFQMQASADIDDLLVRVQRLMDHPDFSLTNPNRLRSVVSVFAANVAGFHNEDGTGYAFMADMVLKVDKLNPQVASRLALAFSTWPKLDESRQTLIKEQLQMLIGYKDQLSKDTYEVVSKVSQAA